MADQPFGFILNKQVSLLLFKVLLLMCGCFATHTALAQFNSPLERNINLAVEQEMNASGEVFFSSWRPYLQEHISEAKSDVLIWNQPVEGRSWWHRKFFQESILTRKGKGYFLYLDPMFEFGYGHESGTERKLYVNTRGAKAGARLGEHFAFETDFYENQSAVPIQVEEFIEEWRVVPGQGQARRFKDTGWDYAMASGYISWSPIRSQNVQFGHGKHFIGEGYRSVLLSDNAFNYPYLKYTLTLGRWQYVRTIASLMNLTRDTSWEEWQKKTAGFDYLTVDINNRVQISIFESNIWQNPDSTGKFKPSFGLFNPIILTNTLFTKNKDDIHSLVGINAKVIVTPSIVAYGQLVLDDVMNTTRKSGFQIGAKYFDVLDINGLFIQAEYNQVAKGTYSFDDNTSISYVHYNQTLAHPLGDNFVEAVALASYRYRRIRLEYRFNYAKEKDSDAVAPKEFAVYSYGKKVIFNHIQAAWIMNPKTQMQIAMGYTSRNETSTVIERNTGVFFVAFRTSLRNRYYDF